MRENRLRKLFRHYRERGDVEALAAVFEETAPSLLVLARHLTGRAEEAEDVLQATFLTAIERCESYDASRPLRPWLTGILVRKAHRAREERSRTGEEASEEVPSLRADPVTDASAAELGHDLRHALERLPDSYRLVLQPFLEEGERPQEIARRQGVAPGTVRVRIHRGLARLRKALPAAYATGALAATTSGAGFQRLRAGVLERARSAALERGPLAATAGVSTLSTAWIAPALTAVATVAAVGLWRAGRESDAPRREGERPTLAAAPGRPEPAPGQELEPAARTRADLAGPPRESTAGPADRRVAVDPAPAQAEERWKLVANVSGLGYPVPPGVRLRAWRVRTTGSSSPAGDRLGSGVEGDEGSVSLLVAEAPLLSDGRVTVGYFDGPPPALEVSVDHGAFAEFRRPVPGSYGRELVVDVPLERVRQTITGRVLACGEEAPWVGFFPEHPGKPSETSQRLDKASCEPDGTFRLHPEATEGWFAAVAGACAPAGERLRLEPLGVLDLGTLELTAGAAIEGVARLQGSRLETPGRVTAHRAVPEGTRTVSLFTTRLALLEDGVARASLDVRTEPDGAFRLAGLNPGLHDLFFLPPVTASGTYDPEAHGTRVPAPSTGIELDSPIRTYTIQVVTGGEPVADATVHYFLDGGSASGPTETDGRYPFFMAWLDGRHRVEISKPGFASRELELGPRDFGEDYSLTVELERSTPPSELVLELSQSAGEAGPIGPLEVVLRLAGTSWTLRRTCSDAGGTVALGEVPAGEYELELTPRIADDVRPSRQSTWVATTTELSCRPGAAERLGVRLVPGGRAVIHLTGLDERGPGNWNLSGPIPTRTLRLLAWDENEEVLRQIDAPAEVGADGAYWVRDSLPAGVYRLLVTRPGTEPIEHVFDVSAGSTIDVYLEL